MIINRNFNFFVHTPFALTDAGVLLAFGWGLYGQVTLLAFVQ